MTERWTREACFFYSHTWLVYPLRVGHLIRPAHTQFLTIYPVLTEIQVFGCFAIDILFFLRWFRWHGLMLRAVHFSLTWGRHPSKLSPWTTTINRTHVLFGKAPPTNTVGVSLSAIYPIRDDAAFSQCISGQWLAEKLSNDHSTSPLRDADPNIFDWQAKCTRRTKWTWVTLGILRLQKKSARHPFNEWIHQQLILIGHQRKKADCEKNIWSFQNIRRGRYQLK